jgi:hypothetical protein
VGKSDKNKTEKPISSKIEEVEAQIAFAEAGELYSPNQQKKTRLRKAGDNPACVDGETSSGLCTECSDKG